MRLPRRASPRSVGVSDLWSPVRAAIAAAARGEPLILDHVDVQVITANAEAHQVAALFDDFPGEGTMLLTPEQARVLIRLDELPLATKWVWRHCMWPWDWRLPAEASTRALLPAFVTAGLQEATGSATDIRRQRGIHLRRTVPGRMVLTVRPAELGFSIAHTAVLARALP